jgi:outer membrane lipoprotein-sorting protein
MCRLLLSLFLIVLFPLVILGPHLLPGPDRHIDSKGPKDLPDVPDKPGALPSEARMDKLAASDPVAFLKACLARYNRDVKSYSFTFQKQERIGEKLEKKELIDVKFREKPFSVYMNWLEGARKAARVLYVEGENDGKMLVKPTGIGSFLIVSRDPEGEDARKAGRYTLKQFGLKKGLQRSLFGFQEDQKAGTLHVKYLGKQKIKEAGDRTCWVLKRRYEKPDDDGVGEQTLYLDAQTWLMVGTILKDDKGRLLAEYWFRDVKLNPEFSKDPFTRKALTAK